MKLMLNVYSNMNRLNLMKSQIVFNFCSQSSNLFRNSTTKRNFVSSNEFSNDSSNQIFTPLEGIKVLDLTRILAGPFCTMMLGDLGADVIKVEKPGTGDDTRSWGPPWVGKESSYFLSVNRNKKSICVNMKTEKGVNIMKKLAQQCDIFVENFIPGKLEMMGLGYKHLKEINPGLIYVSLTGFGPTGPYSKRGGYDNIISAIGGLMFITGPEDGEPCKTGVALTDLQTGQHALSAILVSLLQRGRTNKGVHINCNLLSTQVASLTHIASNWLNSGMEGKRYGTGHGSIVPYQAFKSKGADCYMMIGVGSDRHFVELCQRIGLSDVAKDDRFKTNAVRVEHRHILIPLIADKIILKTNSEWEASFEGVQFPYGPINNLQSVFQDPQVIHNNMVLEVAHPTAGLIRLTGPPVSYGDLKLNKCTPPPTLGQHTDDILANILQFSKIEIDELRSLKIVS